MRPLLAALALAALTSLAAATLVLRVGLPDLVSGADVIVAGRVVQTATHRDRAGGIATRTTLEVQRAFKGLGDVELFDVILPGGTLGGLTMVVPGMPAPALGSEVLLFLGPTTARGVRSTVGLGQGHFVVQRDPSTGARSLRQSLGDTELLDPATGQRLRHEGDPRFDYDALVAAVVRLVEAER